MIRLEATQLRGDSLLASISTSCCPEDMITRLPLVCFRTKVNYGKDAGDVEHSRVTFSSMDVGYEERCFEGTEWIPFYPDDSLNDVFQVD